VARKPGRPGELEGNRKTIAQGMPVATGEPVALPRAFFCPNHGCIGHPAFPASSLEDRPAPSLEGRARHERMSGRLTSSQSIRRRMSA